MLWATSDPQFQELDALLWQISKDLAADSLLFNTKNQSHRRHIHQVGEAFGQAILKASFANITQNTENIQLCCETNLSLDRIVETMSK